MSTVPIALRRAAQAAVLLACTLAAVPSARAQDLPTVRIGVLKFGTVNWELDVIRHHGLDKQAGVVLDVVEFANKDASTIAFAGGDVDLYVTDWIWVSRQRDAGEDFSFVPYSDAAGAVMVHPGGGVDQLADLRGKSIGVAGSPLDKSWLLLRAYAIKTIGEDLEDITRPVYAAPPLLNAKFEQGELDAVLNYWNYTARLQAAGNKKLIEVRELLPALGVPGRLPLIGYVFRESWARANADALAGFLEASAKARQTLADSDAEWQRLMPLTGAADAATLEALRQGYREGIPKDFGPRQEAAIEAGFAILAALGGRDLVGDSTALAPGTVWSEAY